MELAQPLPSDGQLAVAARDGSAPAWAEVEARHGSAVLAVAKAQRTRRSRRASRSALDRLRVAVVEGATPSDDVAAVRALRPLAVAELTAGSYGPGGGDDSADAGDDAQAICEAFARLPGAWQTVLWHGVVEQRTAAEMTPLLGRGVNEVIALQRTATSGFHETYLRVILEPRRPGVADECRDVVPLLGGGARGTLAAPDQRIVDAHLTTGRAGSPCRACRERLDLVDTLDERLPPAIVPGISRLPADRYRAVVGGRGQAFGSATLLASRSDRVRRSAVASAAVAIVLALLGAVLLIRRPFDNPSSEAGVDGPVPTTATVVTTVEPAGQSTTTSIESPAPTTTELLLRPAPSGPKNAVELVFVPQTAVTGVVAPPLDITVSLSAPAPVFAGGTGTIDVSITNESAAAAELGFEVREPNGLLLDGLVGGDAQCVDRANGAPLCNVSLDGGGTKTLALRFLLESTVVGRLVVESEVVAEPLEVAIDAMPRLVHSSVGRGDIVMIGNTVTSCAETAAECADARVLRGSVVNRWDLPIEFVGADALRGWGNSSSSTLELPAGATVEAAYLVWSGDLRQGGEQVPGDGGHERVSLLAPGQEVPIVVDADRTVLGDVDATLYMGFADVTDVVAGAGAGEYVVADIRTVEVSGSYGGWSLLVVTADAGQPRRELVVTAPFSWFAPADDYHVAIPVPAAGPTAASIDVLAFEGEPDFVPETFVIGETVIGGDNPFDSSIGGPRDPAFVNNFGTDVAAYDLTIDEPDGSLTIRATSAKDGVRMAVIGLAVDLES